MSRNFEDFDEKNIEIAKMLINDSEKITIDEKTNEKIIKSRVRKSVQEWRIS